MKTLKKSMSLILCFAICCTFLTSLNVFALEPGFSAYYDKNLVKDWNFEGGGDDWSIRSNGEICTTDSSLNGAAKNSGMVAEGKVGYIGQEIIVPKDINKADPWYNLHFIAKAEGGANAFVRVRGGSPTGTILRQIHIDSNKWFRPQETGLLDPTPYEKIYVMLEKQSAAGSAYIDGVTLSPRTAGIVKDPPDGIEVEPNLPSADQFTEIWRDDFTDPNLDMSTWEYELGSVRGVEQQHYVDSPENVFIRDGNLILRATDRATESQYDNPRGNRRVIYNSGSVRTLGKKEFLYGKIEMRARLPKGKGVFPAFWTMGSDFTADGTIADDQGYGWPRCGEIDIAELIGGDPTVPNDNNNNYVVYGTAHCYGKWDAGQDHRLGGVTYRQNSPNEPFNNDFHTFGINWSPNKITWYVDGKDYYTAEFANDEIAQRAFNRPQFIQLNLAMGGNWPGDAHTDLAGTEFQIDYVSFSQTEKQKAAAAEYYKTAPKLEGVKDLTFTEGESINLTNGVSASAGYHVDYTVNDAPMFNVDPIAGESANTHVSRVCDGVEEANKLNTLPAGTYKIYYTALPDGLTTDDSRQPDREANYQFARKSAILTIKPSENLKGDIDRNKIVNADDLILLRKHLIDSSILDGNLLNIADLNGDTNIDILDLVLLKKEILK